MNIPGGDIRLAIKSVRGTHWRSLLTTLGIIIGICSVVTVVGLAEGIKHQVASEINQLGKDLITIRPGGNTLSPSATNSLEVLTPFGSTNSSSGSLSLKDEKVIEETPNVAAAAPMSIVPGVVKVGSQPAGNVTVLGTSPQAPQLLSQTLSYGNFFTSSDQNENVAVLGPAASQALFSNQVPLGMSFTFHGQQFVVRGEFNQFDIAPFSLDTDFNNAIFIPYEVAEGLDNNTAPIYEVLAKPTNPNQTDAVASAIQSRLLQAHDGVQNFSVLKQQKSLAATNDILDLLTKLIGGVAAVSLLVGGISVMNIMLVSVTERTHEIGIRKALGATNRQILSQFLVEAMVLSLFGGLMGVALSVVVNVALRIFTSLQPVLSWQIIVLATGVSLVVGIIFGIAPALKAARRNPIDALRYYQ